MSGKKSYKDWHIPLHSDNVSLRDAHASMSQVGAGSEEIPLMVQLVENPKFKFPGVSLFHGAVDLKQHDYIHILLGRGLLEKDEAFTIGFTMGTTNKVSTTEEVLYAVISKYLYPNVYRFSDEDIYVFKNAVRLGYISDCPPLDEYDFSSFLDVSLKAIRDQLPLENDLLTAYYNIEKRRFPDDPASKRL